MLNPFLPFYSFMGGNAFCQKACKPDGPNAANFCQHIYDRIGCAYNSPNAAQNGTFESCQGDNQDYAGIYTDGSGQVQTFTQPAESLGAIASMPYQPKVPASSNCATFTSSAIYLATAVPTSGASSPSGSKGGASGSHPSATGSAGGPSGTTASDTGAAAGIVVTSVTTMMGVAFAVAMFA